MKYLFSIVIYFLLAGCSLVKAQSKVTKEFPKIAYSEMLKEHDTLVNYIKQTSPVIYYNKEVRGIDFSRYATQLKKKITPKTTMGEYLQIIKKTLNAAQDGHTS